MESTGDPVRDRENQQKEVEQHKKEEKEKDTAWSNRGGEGWTTSSKSALASGRDDVAASSPPGAGWVKPTSRTQGESTAASLWFRSKGGAERTGGAEPVAPAGPQTPVFHSGVVKKKAPAVVGQADKDDKWSRGRPFGAEAAAPPAKTE